MLTTLPLPHGTRRDIRRSAVRAALAVCTAAAVTGACFTMASPGARAADGDVANSILADLTISNVPPAGLDAFSGTFGTAGSPPNGGLDNGDLSDPSGVLDYLTVRGQAVARTSAEPEKNWAQAQASGFTLSLNDRDFLSVGSLDAYTECIPAPIGPLALAYARTDSNTIGVLGRQVPTGTTQLEVTGAELGTDEVSTATLTVQYEQIEDPAGGGYQPQTSARAGLDITISGNLRDENGQELYDGPLVDVELGHVDVTCAGTTSPPVTTPPPSEVPVTEPPITIPPVTVPPITVPPITVPPVTDPPITIPPVTVPPVTVPPVTIPPITLPPTAPPVTRPPTATPTPTPTKPSPSHSHSHKPDYGYGRGY
ncbi:hypothetical protein YW3DRAFT_01080 [Streptomyces sp. MnatMP-M77]|uniref:hypothetical protein n=1 Tax=unclassified Streptomyces TaxID=2593676 RepID=UPI0008051264|nr:hypothetical protein [Streptomyces sp. MnatMP-M77]MYT78032.1 hypothetical protein [Streptomyces sp. SID8364]SBU91680.1 hypothetical protein YW3DRAFT_01080 [Streptomyces sp. MnatMP-M77]